MALIGQVVSEKIFENVDARTQGRAQGRMNGRRLDQHTLSSPCAFGSGELINDFCSNLERNIAITRLLPAAPSVLIDSPIEQVLQRWHLQLER